MSHPTTHPTSHRNMSRAAMDLLGDSTPPSAPAPGNTLTRSPWPAPAAPGSAVTPVVAPRVMLTSTPIYEQFTSSRPDFFFSPVSAGLELQTSSVGGAAGLSGTAASVSPFDGESRAQGTGTATLPRNSLIVIELPRLLFTLGSTETPETSTPPLTTPAPYSRPAIPETASKYTSEIAPASIPPPTANPSPPQTPSSPFDAFKAFDEITSRRPVPDATASYNSRLPLRSRNLAHPVRPNPPPAHPQNHPPPPQHHTTSQTAPHYPFFAPCNPQTHIAPPRPSTPRIRPSAAPALEPPSAKTLANGKSKAKAEAKEKARSVPSQSRRTLSVPPTIFLSGFMCVPGDMEYGHAHATTGEHEVYWFREERGWGEEDWSAQFAGAGDAGVVYGGGGVQGFAGGEDGDGEEIGVGGEFELDKVGGRMAWLAGDEEMWQKGHLTRRLGRKRGLTDEQIESINRRRVIGKGKGKGKGRA